MLRLSFDESGNFESGDSVLLIGGVLYDDLNTAGDAELECKRIESYLQKVCDSVGALYPKYLHDFAKMSSEDKDLVVRVKKGIEESIAEFITTGCYDGTPVLEETRQGRYHLIAYISSPEGMSERQKKTVSTLVRDSVASNLYLHMAEETLLRLLFHNPVIPYIKEVWIDIATRKSVVSEKDNKNAEYASLGYQSDKKYGESINSDKVYYRIATADYYRTVVSREMIRTGKKQINIKPFNVRSIYYGSNPKDMGFLYMSDIICSIFRKTLYNESDPSNWLYRVSALATDITGHGENLVYGYDDIDQIYAYAWDAYIANDYYTVYKTIFSLSSIQTSFAKYYKEVLFRDIQSRIESSQNELFIKKAIIDLHDSTFSNNIDQKEIKYIFDQLKSLSACERDNETKYKLYDAGISAFNHLGRPNEAMECFERCRSLAEYTDIEDYIRTYNKAIVAKTDSFDFAGALQLADCNINNQRSINDLKRKILSCEPSCILNPALGRCYSQKAQSLAFMLDEHAEEEFKNALSLFKKDSADYKITQSYLLHFYIEMRDRRGYEREAYDYFDGNTVLYDQFAYIVKDARSKTPKYSLKFALYVFIKALYVFYQAEIDRDERLEKLVDDIDSSIIRINKDAKREIHGHPWEIIYKYLAVLAINRGNRALYELYTQHLEEYESGAGYTIEAINLYALIEVYTIAGEKTKAAEQVGKLWTLLENKAFAFPDINKEDIDGRIDVINRYMTYMYH